LVPFCELLAQELAPDRGGALKFCWSTGTRSGVSRSRRGSAIVSKEEVARIMLQMESCEATCRVAAGMTSRDSQKSSLSGADFAVKVSANSGRCACRAFAAMTGFPRLSQPPLVCRRAVPLTGYFGR